MITVVPSDLKIDEYSETWGFPVGAVSAPLGQKELAVWLAEEWGSLPCLGL